MLEIMNFKEALESGEYVMIGLCVLLLIAIVLWIVRATQLNSWKHTNSRLMQRVTDYLMEGDVENAVSLCRGNNSPGGRIILAGLRCLGRPMPEIYSAMQGVMASERPVFNKALFWLKGIAVISPLAGFTGSLAGVSHRFYELSLEGPSVEMAQLAAVISPALVTTIAGLIVGILVILIYLFLEEKINRTEKNHSELILEFTDLLNEPS